MSGSPTTSQRTWMRVGFAIALAVVFLVAVFSRVSVREVAHTLATASPAWLLASLSVAGSALVAHACRTCVLVGVAAPRQLLRFARVHFIGSVLDGILPAQIGTDSVRIVATRDGLSKLEVARLILLDRFVGLFVHCSLASLVLATVFRGVYPNWVGVLPFVAVVMAGVVWVIARHPEMVTGFLLRSRVHSNDGEPDGPRAAAAITPLPYARLLLLVGFAALHMSLLAIAFETSARCLGLALPSLKLGAAYAIIGVSGVVTTLSIGGFGVREMSFWAILGPLGVEPDAAVALSLFWFLVTKSSGALGALALARSTTHR